MALVMRHPHRMLHFSAACLPESGAVRAASASCTRKGNPSETIHVRPASQGAAEALALLRCTYSGETLHWVRAASVGEQHVTRQTFCPASALELPCGSRGSAPGPAPGRGTTLSCSGAVSGAHERGLAADAAGGATAG